MNKTGLERRSMNRQKTQQTEVPMKKEFGKNGFECDGHCNRNESSLCKNCGGGAFPKLINGRPKKFYRRFHRRYQRVLLRQQIPWSFFHSGFRAGQEPLPVEG